MACTSDTDADRHGIVSHTQGLLNPNHYLAVAIAYLFANRPQWPGAAAVGKTVVSSSLIDRVTAHLGRRLVEVPVGFNGPLQASSMGRWRSAARRARGRPSYAATALCGPRIKTASCRTC